MTQNREQVFNCKTTGCTGKVKFIDQVIPAIRRVKKTEQNVDVELSCDNLSTGPHTNFYTVEILR
jgi:hypothetical protein